MRIQNSSPALLLTFCLAVALVPAASAADNLWSLRLAVGTTGHSHTVLSDASCNAEQPPALFGCGYRARGTWGRATVAEVAIGYRLRPDVRVEVAAFALRGFALDANANFPRVTDVQPVDGKLSTDALFAVAYWEPAVTFGWHLGRLAPFVGAGVGGARHRLDPVTFRFPGIGPAAVTVTQGGRSSDGAWLATAGAAWAFTDRLALEVAVRRLDLGGAETASGAATIVRPTRTFAIAVAPTRARVRADEVAAALRWSW